MKLQSYVDQAFKKELFKVSPEEKPEYNGIQLINSKVIVSYLKQLLRNDLQYTPFEMVAMEKKVSEEITIQTGQGPFTLRLGGTIDRMDAKESTLRIVDYKTGGSPKYLLISSNCSPHRKHARTISSRLFCMLLS